MLDLGAEMFGIGADGADRLGRGLEEDIVDDRLVLQGDRCERGGYGEDEMKIRDWQKFGAAVGQAIALGTTPAAPASSCQSTSSRGSTAAFSSNAYSNAFGNGRLSFYSAISPHPPQPAAFARHLAPLRRVAWVVYTETPESGSRAGAGVLISAA